VVRQRSAKPPSPVQIRAAPPTSRAFQQIASNTRAAFSLPLREGWSVMFEPNSSSTPSAPTAQRFLGLEEDGGGRSFTFLLEGLNAKQVGSNKNRMAGRLRPAGHPVDDLAGVEPLLHLIVRECAADAIHQRCALRWRGRRSLRCRAASRGSAAARLHRSASGIIPGTMPPFVFRAAVPATHIYRIGGFQGRHIEGSAWWNARHCSRRMGVRAATGCRDKMAHRRRYR
jgi:hypothetical protein